MRDIISDLRFAKTSGVYQNIHWRERRRVDWYSNTVKQELAQIVGWINLLGLDEAEKTVVAVALSTAARNASYCRNGRWKLHRMAECQRATHACSAWEAFGKALRYYVDYGFLCSHRYWAGSTLFADKHKGYSRHGEGVMTLPLPADLILTSPPYGDSKSTVQYGAASSLCLDVVSQVSGLEELYVSWRED